jgi:CubicO group peptidase (beta-lactamase class C family)
VLERSVLDRLADQPTSGRALVQPGDCRDIVRSRLDTGREVELAAALGMRVEALGAPPLGRAQDGNARTLGGLPGHAGLFADLATTSALGNAWLGAAGWLDGHTRDRALSGRGTLWRGWRRRRVRGSAGPALSSTAFGHDGFTGGSLWVDPTTGLVLVLLGHRTDPFLDLGPLRRTVHRLGALLAGC